MESKVKGLLTVVALAAVCVASSRADSYNVPLFQGGYIFLGNELNNSAGNYISNVLQNLSASDSVLKFDAAGQGFYPAQKSDTLNPGEGVAVMHGGGAAFLTISGTPAAAQPPLTLSPGQFRLVGRRVGGLGPSTYDDLVGAPPVEGSTLLLWSAALQDFVSYALHNNQWTGPGGSTNAPQVPQGASAFVILQPPITVTNTPGGQLIIVWTAPRTWTLEGADNAGGPWTIVTNATSPFTIPTGPQSQKFYRLHGTVSWQTISPYSQ